jgi:hypothetical protein
MMPELRPEKDERNVFVLGCLLIPVLIYLYSTWIDKRRQLLLPIIRIVPIVIYALIVLVSYFLLFTNRLDQEHITVVSNASAYPFTFASFVLIVSVALFMSYKWIELQFNKRIAFLFFGGGVSIFAISGSLLRLAPNNETFFNGYHFSAVFNSVAMAYQGKTLLTDVVNTYGLYPHILSPVFNVFGLTPQSFCTVMSLSLLLSLTLLILVIYNNVQNNWIKIFGSIAIIDAICFYRPYLNDISIDFYFQYTPIRILFPSLVLFLSSLYFNSQLQSKKNLYYFSTFIIASVGPLWNSDTGIVSLLAWYATLIIYDLATCSSLILFLKQFLKHFVTGVLALATTLIAFSLWVNFSTGKSPDFSNYFLMTKLFYEYGYYMARAPLWHVWMLYIAICIAGLAFCVKIIRNRKSPTPRALVFCVLTIISTGAFSYYQGRSETTNLIGPGYLVILLLVFMADILWSSLVSSKKFNFLIFSIFYICITPVALCSVNYFSHQKVALDYLYAQHIEHRSGSNLTLATQIKKYSNLVKDNEKTLVFSFASGSIHLFTKTQSYAFDSFSELFLVKDRFEIIDGMKNKLCRILYIDRGFPIEAEFQNLINLNYHLIAHVENTNLDIMETN